MRQPLNRSKPLAARVKYKWILFIANLGFGSGPEMLLLANGNMGSHQLVSGGLLRLGGASKALFQGSANRVYDLGVGHEIQREFSFGLKSAGFEPAATWIPPKRCWRNSGSVKLASVWPNAVYHMRPSPIRLHHATG